MNKCDVFLTNIPKKMRKQMKKDQKGAKNASEKPSDEAVQDKRCAMAVDSEDMLFTIILDDKSGQLMATDGENTYAVSNLGNRAVGEKWNGKLVPIPGGSVAYLLTPYTDPEPEEIVEELSDEEIEEKIEENLEEVQSDAEPTVDAIAVQESSSIVDESELVKDLRKQLKDANSQIFTLEKQLKDYPHLKDTIKKKNTAIKSLTTQVKSLEKKTNVRDFDNMSSELNRYKSDCDAKDKEIARLKRLVEFYGSSSKEDSPKAFITGNTSIHSMMFDCMKYRVYFSPGKKTLRFIPDDQGSVTVNDKEVTIPALGGYSNFLKPRALEVEKNGSEVLIRLA